jgi:tRNA uridine 5-carboxymethylaminomethyl modification enzyme
LSQLLRRPEISIEDIHEKFPPAHPLPKDLRSALEIETKFAGYLSRQEEEVQRLKKIEVDIIPADFPYDAIKQLRTEAREKLKKHRPATIGQAMRIPGMTPSAVSLLAVYLKRFRAGQIEAIQPPGCD